MSYDKCFQDMLNDLEGHHGRDQYQRARFLHYEAKSDSIPKQIAALKREERRARRKAEYLESIEAEYLESKTLFDPRRLPDPARPG